MERILISKCLVGEKVRYDGDHCKIPTQHLNELKKQFELIELCPEVYAGMTIPRNPIERVGARVLDQSGSDYTSQFNLVKKHLDELILTHKFTKAILKEFSPSCGSKKIYDGTFSGNIIDGQGIITEYLRSKEVRVFSEKELSELLNTST